jgi:hypothetical protein
MSAVINAIGVGCYWRCWYAELRGQVWRKLEHAKEKVAHEGERERQKEQERARV